MSKFETHFRIILAKTDYAIDLAIKPSVVVAEETDIRTDLADQVINTFGFAVPESSPPMPIEDHSGWCAVDEKHIDPTFGNECVDLITLLSKTSFGL